jgi:hypothetical protein
MRVAFWKRESLKYRPKSKARKIYLGDGFELGGVGTKKIRMVAHPSRIEAGHFMALELKQAPKLVQQLVITPQLQQAIRLLH